MAHDLEKKDKAPHFSDSLLALIRLLFGSVRKDQEAVWAAR